MPTATLKPQLDELQGLLELRYGDGYPRLYWLSGARRGRSAGCYLYRRNKPYVSVMIDGRRYTASQLVWFLTRGYWVNRVGHFDGDLMNLHPDNLFDGVSLMRTNPTGFRGVKEIPRPYLHSPRWFRGQYKSNGKTVTSKSFKNPEEAARWYDEHCSGGLTNQFLGYLPWEIDEDLEHA